MPGQPDFDELASIARELAIEAGGLLVREARRPRQVSTKSTRTDMVTEVDRAAEALLVERLGALRPGDGVLGEEGGERPGTTGVRWVIDPLDGTTNYVYGFPAFCVAIGVEWQGEVVAGAVRDAVHGETFTATAGRGASRDGEPIHVTDESDLGRALVATGFGYDPARRAVQGAALARIVPRVRDIRRGGSAALDLCWVACGRLDAYYEVGLQHWDMAAAVLIVREAGGLTGAFASGIEGASSIVAAGRGVFEPLKALVDAAHREMT